MLIPAFIESKVYVTNLNRLDAYLCSFKVIKKLKAENNPNLNESLFTTIILQTSVMNVIGMLFTVANNNQARKLKNSQWLRSDNAFAVVRG